MSYSEGRPVHDQSNLQKTFIEFGGERFEVDHVNMLKAQDIKPGDRTMISTESGNRYMIRWSSSANAPKVYNEQADQFSLGIELANQYSDGKPVAETGKPFEFIIVVDKENSKGRERTSTNVTAIEIRRGVDAAIQKNQSGDSVSFGGIASMLRDEVTGKK